MQFISFTPPSKSFVNGIPVFEPTHKADFEINCIIVELNKHQNTMQLVDFYVFYQQKLLFCYYGVG